MKHMLLVILTLLSLKTHSLEGVHLGKHLSKQEFGDLDVLVERRYFKVLTNKNSLNYFLHKGVQRGFQYEMLRIFNKDLNKNFNLQKGKIKIQFEVIPVAKKDLIPMLLDGRVILLRLDYLRAKPWMKELLYLVLTKL